MQRAPPEDEDPDAVSVHSSQAPSRAGSLKPPRSQTSRKSRSQLSRQSRDPAAEAIEEEGPGMEEIKSDVQEASEIARTVHIESMGPQGYVSPLLSFGSTPFPVSSSIPCSPNFVCAHICVNSKSILRRMTNYWTYLSQPARGGTGSLCLGPLGETRAHCPMMRLVYERTESSSRGHHGGIRAPSLGQRRSRRIPCQLRRERMGRCVEDMTPPQSQHHIEHSCLHYITAIEHVLTKCFAVLVVNAW